MIARFVCIALIAATSLTACDGEDDLGNEEQQEHTQEQQPPIGPTGEIGREIDFCQVDSTETCRTEDGSEGTSYCFAVGQVEHWTECLVEAPACTAADTWSEGCSGTYCAWDGENFFPHRWEDPDPECYTPLVVNFDNAPLQFTAASAASFDIAANGQCMSTDWPELPWLALDRDQNGIIEDGSELFGSGTRMAAGGQASNGFEALRELDHNRDGKIDARDPAFAKLVLWSDSDGDRRGSLHEQVSLTTAGLESIDLDFAREVECDSRGNCGAERSAFTFRSANGTRHTGQVIDVYLPCQ